MNAKTIGFVALTAVLLYFPLFLKLDFLPFRLWDESRTAVQAYEMNQSGNVLVTTYNGKPDLWHSKPPLLVWLQVTCIQVFGTGELAVRLPSALAALATCVLLMGFLHRVTRSWWLGLMAALVLVTTAGYVTIHGSRTGDMDALLTFFLTLSAFSFYLYTEEAAKPKYLYVFFLGLLGAVLVKSVAGLFFLPAFFVFSLWRKNTLSLLSNRHFYGGLLLFLLVVGGFYGLRELAGPGYLKAVWQNELMGRYGETLEGHKHGFFFYVEHNLAVNAPLWVCLFPIGVLAGLFNRDPKLKRLTQYALLILVQHLLLISLSQTKIYWYDVPLYPFWAILIAIPIYMGYRILLDRWDSHVYFTRNFVPYVFLILLFFIPYQAAFNRANSNSEPNDWDEPYYALSNYLRLVDRGEKPSLDGWAIAYDEYYGAMLPYTYQLAEKGQHVAWIEPHEIQPGQQVLTNRTPVKNYIDSAYIYTVVDTFESVKLYRVEGTR